MTSDVQNGLIKWSSSPRDYQWKGTISINTNTWSVLAHCKPLKSDVFIKIKQLATNDSNTDLDAFAATINNLINLHHSNLLTPVHSFHAKNDIWIIYPLSSGGPLSELLKNHYPNGIPDESIVACLLKDAAEALQYLHNHQIVHRNIRASSLHVNCIEGITLLTEFDVLKPIKFKHAKTRHNTMVTVNRYPWTDPLILSDDPHISWFQGDIYSFGVTALELVFGEIPPSKVIPNKIDLKQFMNNINYDAVGVDSYDKPCPFGKAFQSFIINCCSVNFYILKS